MRVNVLNTVSCKLNFKRKLTASEKAEYKKTVNSAFDYLDIKNRALIIHGSSFPAGKFDSGIGSPYSENSDKFLDFISLHGFNSVQLGPGGKMSKGDNSPYRSRVYAKNELFIDLKKLTNKKYASVLSDEEYKKFVLETKKTDENYSYSDFDLAKHNTKNALKLAYGNFKKKLVYNDETAVLLKKELRNFEQKNRKWLIFDGVFNVLVDKYGTNDTEKWEEKDKFLPLNLKKGAKSASLYMYNLIKQNLESLKFNNFVQFIADKQLKDSNSERSSKGLKYIGDVLVGFSPSDVWVNQDAFLKGWKLGCPFGGVNNGPQTWNIDVLDPDKFFNKDGSLGVSGKVLFEKLDYALENYDNIRIDHALGLVDPYIYKESTLVIKNNEVDHSKLVADNISNFKHVDPNGNYKKVLEKIVLPVFEKHNLDKKSVVWEDLCTQSAAFLDIYYNKLKLPGIIQSEHNRLENRSREFWSLIGSHDSKPVILMNKQGNAWNPDYLSGYLIPDPAKTKLKDHFKQEIINNPRKMVEAKFIELLRGTKNIQIMFSDLLGIKKTYNLGGQYNNDNWKLRVVDDYEDKYHKSLEDNTGALNIPELLLKAVISKNDMAVAKLYNTDRIASDTLRKTLEVKSSALIIKLDKFAKILKEKSVNI